MQGAESFRISLDKVVWEELRLQRARARRAANYELVWGFGQPVATFSFGVGGSLASMESSAGEWRLFKRRRLGWELIIEAEDGRRVGWYSGRKWRSGGTIFLRAGPQLDVMRSVLRGWTLQTVEYEEPVMYMRGSFVPLRVKILRSLLQLPDAHIAVLTACAIPLLEPLVPASVS